MNTGLILLNGESFKKFQTLVCLLVISKQKSKTLGSNSSHTHTHTHMIKLLKKDINADGLSRLILYIGLIPVSVIHGQWGLVHSAWNTQTLNDFHFAQMTTQQ